MKSKPCTSFDAPLITALAPAAQCGPLLVGFSGGLDSTVLLHALATLAGVHKPNLRALHVDHGLHAASTHWASHCQQVCEQLGVPLTVMTANVDQHQLGPEGAARHARYALFESELRTGETLCLAHQHDDQAETVLLRLLRGAGSNGLTGIPSRRPLAKGMLWRPLLALTRTQLRTYAQAHGLRWIDDPSNGDLRFDRNFLRQQVMPLLRQRWPQAETALSHSARWLAEEAELLDTECVRHLMSVRGETPDTLMVAALQALPPAWQSRVLRHWLAEQNFPALPLKGPAIVLGELLSARTDAVPDYAWSGTHLRRWAGRLWAERAVSPWPALWQQRWDGNDPVTLPDGRQFILDGITPGTVGDFLVRNRTGGERIVLPGRRHHSDLKSVLQSLAVPPWQRSRLPLLFDVDGELLAVGEHISSARMQASGWRFQPVPADDSAGKLGE